MPNWFDRLKHRPQQSPILPRAERRRSPRWSAHVPIFVYGHAGAEDQSPFYEDAYSTVVSERGALLVMTTPVSVGQKLLLVNKATEVERECRVAKVGRRDGPNIEIAVEFPTAAPEFWRITAPPRAASFAEPFSRAKTL